MRFIHLVLWDMKFQAKSGFYYLYALLTVIYLFLLSAIPGAWKAKLAAALIFSDPAAMGLFFMGAILLLEKSQRIPCALAVSPIYAAEYIASKVISLNVIALVVSAVIAMTAGAGNLFLILAGTLLSGTIFTLLGIIVAAKITSLNQFILWVVPFEIIGFTPAILHLYGISPAWMRYYPPNVCMDMISGSLPSLPGLVLTVLLIAWLYYVSRKRVLIIWKSAGGLKL